MISNRHVEFFRLLTDSQSRLYAYILSLVADPERARDVLQETNLVLIRKADEFEIGTNFIAWSFSVARYQILASHTRRSRDRLVFSEDVVAGLTEEFDAEGGTFDDELQALDCCLERLPEHHRRLIEQRYQKSRPIKSIAGELGQTANAVAVKLHRIRKTLLECIRGVAQRDGVVE